jgi:hypothetical protein
VLLLTGWIVVPEVRFAPVANPAFRLKAEATGPQPAFRLKPEATGPQPALRLKPEATGPQPAFRLKPEATTQPLHVASAPKPTHVASAFRRKGDPVVTDGRTG